jgi:hypothetical protein
VCDTCAEPVFLSESCKFSGSIVRTRSMIRRFSDGSSSRNPTRIKRRPLRLRSFSSHSKTISLTRMNKAVQSLSSAPATVEAWVGVNVTDVCDLLRKRGMSQDEGDLRSGDDARSVALVSLTGLLFVCAVYLPDLGRGFIRDDFAWILSSRGAFDHMRTLLWPTHPGFYRPIVSLSFAIDYTFHGLNSRGYGFTNFTLFLLCIGGVAYLSRTIRLSWRASALAAFVWALNPHGINMALLWISGRTALCLTLFAVLAVAAFVRRQYGWAAACLGAALGSKEEAVLLPVIMWTWHRLVVRREDPGHDHSGLIPLAALVVPLAIYFAIRAQTLLPTITSAPPYYQFTFAPGAVIRNAFEYFDRGATASAVVVLFAWVVYPVRAALRSRDVRLLTGCAIWFGVSYAITMFLPLRSSLYVLFPSVASSIGCAVLVERMRELALGQRRSIRLDAVFATFLLFIPIQRSRNTRWVEPARLSQRALRTMAIRLRTNAEGLVVLQDNPDRLSSFSGAFGGLGAEALYLWTGRNFDVSIRPNVPDQTLGAKARAQNRVVAVFRVERGRVESVGLTD